MSIFFPDHKNIFEILKEDDGSDIINGGDAGASDADSTAANTTDNGSGDADASTTTDTDNTEDAGGDDEFNIDTSLDDEEGGEGEDEEGGDTGSDDTSAAPSEDEAVPANKDIFTTLTAEEQAIKIKEQKKQFNDMYIYIDDLISKIGDIQLDEDNATIIERISKRLYNLREYLNEYITDIYATKDYISNDIFYTRFLQVLYSIDSVMQDLAKSRAKKLGLDIDETEKK